MPRNKMKPEEKKISFGITLDPLIVKLLNEQSELEGKSKSKLIEDVVKEHFKNINLEDD